MPADGREDLNRPLKGQTVVLDANFALGCGPGNGYP